MADSVLPKTAITGIARAAPQPSLTYSFDPDTNRIAGMVDGVEAVAQWARHAIASSRYANLVYDPNYGTEIDAILGEKDVTPAYMVSAIKRQVRDALGQDVRITGVANIDVTFEDDAAYVSFDMSTVFGDTHVESQVR